MMSTYEKVLQFIAGNRLQSQFHIDKIGLFGSILKKDDPNDIDILIEKYADYKDLIYLKSELEAATGKSVDIVIEKYASPIILYRAKQDIKYVS